MAPWKVARVVGIKDETPRARTFRLALGDASWVGYRLAELLPLPLPIKQSMLEINDSEVRLKALAQFLKQQGLL